MNSTDAILCVDVGSSGCRAALTRPDGATIQSAHSDYTIDFRGDAATLDPSAVADAVEGVISAALKEGPSSVTMILSTAMHGLLLVDDNGRPLGQLSTWADARGAEALERWRTRAETGGWYSRTGAPPLPHYPLYRLLHLRATSPDLLDRADAIVSLKSWLLVRWTGAYREDHTMAAGTGLLRMKDRRWDPEILEASGLETARFPEPVATTTEIAPAAGRLPRAIRSIVIGSGDGPLAHLGAAGRDPGASSITIGTSGAIRRLEAEPWIDARLKTWTYPLDETAWVSGAATSNAGNVLDHYGKAAGRPRISPLELDHALARSVSNPRLLASPYLFRERNALVIRPQPFGFLGGSEAHTDHDRLRAVVEGIVFNLVLLHETLSTSRPATSVALTGTLAESRHVAGIFAALLPVPVYTHEPASAALEGARALLVPHDSRARVPVEPIEDAGLAETYGRWKDACFEKSEMP